MIIPGPSYIPIVSVENIKGFLDTFKNLPDVRGGVAVYGSAAAYALVWEYGSSRLTNPGPKTLWSTNFLGEDAILTKQAPLGYINIYKNEFWRIIKEEMSKVEFKGTTPRIINLEMQVAMDNASQRIATLIASHAPVDTGDLASQIGYVDSADSELLNASQTSSASILIL